MTSIGLREIQQIHCEYKVEDVDIGEAFCMSWMKFMLTPCLSRIASFCHGGIDACCCSLGFVHFNGHIDSIIVDVFGIFQYPYSLLIQVYLRHDSSFGCSRISPGAVENGR